jgi:hypothetical protein
MISKYNDFILENVVINLILEGELDASPAFLDRLKLISKKSKIAELLYTRFYDSGDYVWEVEKDLPQNFIDITDKDDTITFLSDSRFSSLAEESPYEDKKRGEIKIGRFVKSFLTDKQVIKDLEIDVKFTDKEYEEFVNLYKSSNEKNENKFELVKGKDIIKYYNEGRYAYLKGQLGNSCMRYDTCKNYFDIYVKNPDVCNLLVYLNNSGDVLGRALIWKVEKSPCDATYFMDRIYTSADSDVLKFKKYAEEKGWMVKYKQSCDISESYFFEFKGNLFLGEVSVKLDSYKFNMYPFVDTLSNLREDGLISNIRNRSPLEFKELTSDNGSFFKCFDCGGSGFDGSEDCDECDGTGKKYICDKCEGSGKSSKLNKKSVQKDCKKCSGIGYIECVKCEGTGNQECEGCVGSYKSNLEDIRDNERNKTLVELATKELEKLSSQIIK